MRNQTAGFNITIKVFSFFLDRSMKNQSAVNSLINQLKDLQLSHQRELHDLQTEHQRAEQELLDQIAQAAPIASSPPPLPASPPVPHHCDRTGVLLQVGDIVRLNTKAKSGRIGDLATVVRLSKRIELRLHSTGTFTNRVSTNLTFVRSASSL